MLTLTDTHLMKRIRHSAGPVPREDPDFPEQRFSCQRKEVVLLLFGEERQGSACDVGGDGHSETDCFGPLTPPMLADRCKLAPGVP